MLVSSLAGCSPGDVVALEADEARHLARVRRGRVGDVIALLDGLGSRGAGTVDAIEGRGPSTTVRVRVTELAACPQPIPLIEVWSACPKGDRLPAMVEMLGQVGAAAWVPVRASRSVVDPRLGKLDRLRRVALESVKQSRRAWAMRIGEPVEASDDAFFRGDAGTRVVLAEPGAAVGWGSAGGSAWGSVEGRSELRRRLSGASVVRLLIGPEGGWTDDELARARGAGVTVIGLGPHVMRIGTAAVVGAAMLVADGIPMSDGTRKEREA